MAGKRSTSRIASKAGRALRSKRTSGTTKSLAGHVLGHQAKRGGRKSARQGK